MKLALYALMASSIALLSVSPVQAQKQSKSASHQASSEKSEGGSSENQAVDILRRMQQKYSTVKSVRGSFTQQREDPTFKKTITSPANFMLLKPNYFRADYQAPEPSTQLIYGNTSYTYVPKLKQVTTYKFKNESSIRDLNYLLLGFGANTDEVLKVYHVSPLKSGFGVQLVPRESSDFKYILMEVDPNTLSPVRFSMEQPDKTKLSVVIDPSSVQMNAPLSPGDFKPNFPAGTRSVSMQ
jgi:outer membrane lipoprotein carrier protein